MGRIWHDGECRWLHMLEIGALQGMICIICGDVLERHDTSHPLSIELEHLKPKKSPGGSCGCRGLVHRRCNMAKSNRHTIKEMWELDRYRHLIVDHEAARLAYLRLCDGRLPLVKGVGYFEDVNRVLDPDRGPYMGRNIFEGSLMRPKGKGRPIMASPGDYPSDWEIRRWAQINEQRDHR